MKKLITTAMATVMMFTMGTSAFAATYDVKYDRTNTGTLEYIYSVDGFIQMLSTPNPDGVVSAEIVENDPNSYAFVEEPQAVYTPIKMVTIEVAKGVTIDLTGKSNFEIGLLIEDEQGNYYDDEAWADIAISSGDLEAAWDSNAEEYMAEMEIQNPYDESVYGSYEEYRDRMLYDGVLSGELCFIEGSFLKVNTPGVYRVHVQINDMSLGHIKDSVIMVVVDADAEDVADTDAEELIEEEVAEEEVVEEEVVEEEVAEEVAEEVEEEVEEVVVEEVVIEEVVVEEVIVVEIPPVVEEIVIAPAPTPAPVVTTTANVVANPRTLEAGDIVYVTEKYDTFGKIALNNYGTYGVHKQLSTVNTAILKSTNYQVTEGMQVHLPETLGSYTRLAPLNTSVGKIHVVKAGETLSKIAATYYGDTKKATTIFEANSDRIKSINMIYEGQEIIIPGIY